MAHLKKKGGHLALDGTTGKLVKDCDCCIADCTGVDPLCNNCDCDASDQTEFLANTYTLTVSGFPAICGADNLNGAHTITHGSNCVWNITLAGGEKIAMVYSGGATPWRIDWDVSGIPDATGRFLATGIPEDCDPKNYTWAHSTCTEIGGACVGLCAIVIASVAMSVSA